MQDTPKSPKQDPNPKVSLLELLVAVVTIISGSAQVIGVGVQILEYRNQSESQSIQVIQKTTPKLTQTKQFRR